MKNFKNVWETKLFYTILPIIPIIILLFITDSFYYDIENLKKTYDKNINQLIDQKCITINAIVENRIAQSKIQNHHIKMELIDLLHKEYNNDHVAIINDLREPSVPIKLYKIYSHVLNKDYEKSKIYDVLEPDNLVFISNSNGILEMEDKLNTHRQVLVYKSWESIISNAYNKDLARKTIDDILGMKHNTHLFESRYAILSNYNISSHFNISKDDLLNDIINTNDILVFKNFDILVPTYITVLKYPDDIIIIREMNLFTIIEPYIHSINKYNDMIEDYRHDMSKLIFLKIISCVVIVSTLLGSFFLALFSALEKNKEKR